MVKARVIVDGIVQGVGYRALVKQIARQLGLKGLVRNVEDTRVEIFCEGPVPKINGLLRKIDIKGRPEDYMSVNVTEIKCFWEGEDGYREAWKPYRGFEVDYGVERLSAFEESTLDDHDFGKLYFSGFRDELKEFREDTNTNFKQMTEKFVGFRDELKEFREETNVNFKQMAEKYGDISKELKAFRETIEKFLEKFFAEYERKKPAKDN